jgi:hypothetical protein
MRSIYVGLLSSLGARAAWACPVCETGSEEAALFIISTLGLFVAGGALLFTGSRAQRSDAAPRGPLDVEDHHG